MYQVVEAEIFPRILHCLKDVDEFVRKNAATCVREIARHTPDLAKLIVSQYLWYSTLVWIFHNKLRLTFDSLFTWAAFDLFKTARLF